jgi:NADP-dependent 3-hydroxy acid dehydrogenase YdfG
LLEIMGENMGHELNDAVIAITGASSGVGAACAKSVVEHGGRVAIGARRVERLEAMVEQLGSDRAVGVAMDVRNPDDSRRLVHEALKNFGSLDAFVANAGIGLYGGIMDSSDDKYAEMIDVNFAGTVWGVRAAVPALLRRGRGDLVIISSVAGLRGGDNEAVYAATKSAQVALAGALDRELREKHIRVTAICPAAIETEFAIGTGRTAGDPWLKNVLRAEDVAEAVLFTLCQPPHVRTTQWTMWSMAESS